MPALQKDGDLSAETNRTILYLQELWASLQRERLMTATEKLLFAAAILLLLSILASKASAKLGVPALLLFLALGMLAGSEGLGGIYFDDAQLSQSLGVVALAFILFAGGLDTQWREIRPILWQGISLSTLGVLITALIIGVVATKLLGFSLLEGVLLGSIVASTDAAAVFSVLKGRGLGIKTNIRHLLEFESGSNDPMAVFLAIGLTGLLANQQANALSLVPTFILQMAVGALMGFVMGKVAVIAINRLRLEYDGLYPVLSLCLVLLIYGATSFLHGNGFLAVYIAGIVMGGSSFIHKRSVMQFNDGLAWLMQIAMFLTLGLLVFPSHLKPVAGNALVLSLVLIFIARPVAVFIGLAFAKLRFKEKLLIAWAGLRGAVPIILATFPLLAGLPKSEIIFNIVFFIVISSVLLQGTTILLVARWLDLTETDMEITKSPIEFELMENINKELVNVEIPSGSQVVGRQIVDVYFPEDALVILISRQGEFIVPRGATVLEAGDMLLLLAGTDDLAKTRAIIEEEAPAKLKAT
jgi:cell volume regulation protein A